ncbi:MAG: 50S ribosomal protein L10 [Dehalococcoidia bacterium]
MPTPKKEQMVEELRERIARSTIAVGADYRGLTVPEMDQLRRKMRGAGIELKVVKNTLTRLAAERAGKPVLEGLIEGPTALAFGYGDIIDVARAFSEYLPTAPASFAVRGFYLDGQVLPARELTELAKLPPREVLLAQVAGQLQSPLATLAALLEAPLTTFLGLIQATQQELVALLEMRARQMEAA